MSNKIVVEINADRPDFRVFSAYFWGDDFYSYDSDGNSFPVNSRKWTQLYMGCRKGTRRWFSINEVNDNLMRLEVSANSDESLCRVVYFLIRETSGKIVSTKLLSDDAELRNPEELINKMGEFDLEERLKKADESIWRKSSDAVPYPNLR